MPNAEERLALALKKSELWFDGGLADKANRHELMAAAYEVLKFAEMRQELRQDGICTECNSSDLRAQIAAEKARKAAS